MYSQIDIIVIVHNGQRTIKSCLDSLLQLDYPRDKLKIIVVDNDSTDNTKEIIQQYYVSPVSNPTFGTFNKIRYVFESKRSRAAARNKGLSIARGEFIAFIDSDCIADKNWLDTLLQGFNRDNVAGCGGKILSYNTESVIEKYYDKSYFRQRAGISPEGAYIPRIITANAMFKREVIKEVGNFDEIFVTCEDTDICRRIYLKGFEFNYVPNAIVYHYHINSLAEFAKHQFEYGRYFYVLYKKYKKVLSCSSSKLSDIIKSFMLLLQYIRDLLLNILKIKEEERDFKIIGLIDKLFTQLGLLYSLIREVFVPIKTAEVDNIRIKNDFNYRFNGFCLKLNPEMFWFMNNEKRIKILNLNRLACYELDEIGSRIWLLLYGNSSKSSILESLREEYDVTKERLNNDFLNLLRDFENSDILIKS